MREMVESGKISGLRSRGLPPRGMSVPRIRRIRRREKNDASRQRQRFPPRLDDQARHCGGGARLPPEGASAAGCALCEYLPEFSRMFLARKTENGFERGEAAKTPVTLLHLLTHSSGLGSGPAGDFQYSSVKPREGDTLASTVNRYAGVWLDFEPGSAQMYSPVLGLDTVARVVEIVSGEPYGDFVQKNIFAPLHMDHTSYRLEDFEKKNIVLSWCLSRRRARRFRNASQFR